MRVLIMLMLALAAHSAFALGTGECIADPFTKRYVEEPNAEAFPRTEIFTCRYQCKSNNGLEEIIGTRTVRIANMSEEARLVVCEGVKLKNNPWGYDFDRVEPFYAFDSLIPEIKLWATENLDRNELFQEIVRLENLKVVLEKVAITYSSVSRENFEYFGDAATRIREISRALPGDTTELEREVLLVESTNGVNPYSMQTGEGLVFGLIKTQARWMLSF